MKETIYISDCDHENIDIEKKIIEEGNLSLKLLQCKSEEDVIENCREAKVLINQYAPITKKVIESLPQLKLVVRYGVGVNNVDLISATENNVQVCNVPDYGMNEVADHALALMLSLTRKIVKMDKITHSGKWDYTESIPLYRHSEQIVGVIGVGRIGKAFISKVQALGCNVIAYDKYFNGEIPGVKMVSFEDLIRSSDVISIHCPSDNAMNLIGEKELKEMKKGCYLINVSRGGIINEEALYKALRGNYIGGAALDVVLREPLEKTSPLFTLDNFICTPHMAWYSEEAAKELKRKVAEESIRFLKGEKVHYAVNKL